MFTRNLVLFVPLVLAKFREIFRSGRSSNRGRQSAPTEYALFRLPLSRITRVHCALRAAGLDYEFRRGLPSVVGRRPVENQLGNLPALNAGAVGAFGAALKLKVHAANRRLRHALLAEKAQLPAVQYCTGRVRALRLDLYRILEVNVKRVARAVGEELGVVLRENVPEPLQLYLNVVVRGTGRAPVQPEAHHEYPLVDAELNRVAAAPVPPLVRPIRAGLESMAHL